jgi:SH3-like domain-containing protein
MRSSPDLNASIVAIVEAGQIVTLRTRQGDWFAVELADGQRGWMFITVLTIDPAIAEAVPEAGTP